MKDMYHTFMRLFATFSTELMFTFPTHHILPYGLCLRGISKIHICKPFITARTVYISVFFACISEWETLVFFHDVFWQIAYDDGNDDGYDDGYGYGYGYGDGNGNGNDDGNGNDNDNDDNYNGNTDNDTDDNALWKVTF